MDLFLQVSDELFLDDLYAKLVPASAFASSLNGTSQFPIFASGPLSSAWSNIVSYLPHPPLPDELLHTTSLASIPITSAWPRDYIPRQTISLVTLTLIGIHILYFVFASLSYFFIFNHEMMKHPRFLKNQVRQEIVCCLKAFPGMMLLTLPWFLAEVRGYSMLYENVEDYGWPYFLFSVFLYVSSKILRREIFNEFISSCSYLFFTDYLIYWIHRWEHHPICYKWLHKPHHKWISKFAPD